MSTDFKEELAELARLKARKAETAAAAEAAARDLYHYEQRLWEQMERVGNNGSSWSDLGTFSRKSTIYGQITDRDAFIEWAREEGLDDVVKMVEEKGRLNEIIRDRLDTQQELPPGTSFYEKRYISYTKKKES
jgi:hypothetical protein